MTLHRLRALAAAHSLAAALADLAHHAHAEAAQIAAEAVEPADGLRSRTYGQRYGSGGHSDPTATTYLIADRPLRINRPQALYDDITDQLAAPAAHLPATATLYLDPLARILDAIPGMSPNAAAHTAAALTRLDDVIRRHLRIGPARAPLAGEACPDCGHRRLEVTTAGPIDARAVVCGGCDGIWPRAAVLSAAPRRIDDLIAASSLGTPDAVAMRDQGRTQLAGELTGMTEEQADWDGDDDLGAVGGAR